MKPSASPDLRPENSEEPRGVSRRFPAAHSPSDHALLLDNADLDESAQARLGGDALPPSLVAKQGKRYLTPCAKCAAGRARSPARCWRTSHEILEQAHAGGDATRCGEGAATADGLRAVGW